MGATGAEIRGILEHSLDFKSRDTATALKKLNIDSLGRLRVSAESAVIASGTVTTVSTVTTCGTVTNLTNWGLFTAAVRSQVDSRVGYDLGYRRNLVVSV